MGRRSVVGLVAKPEPETLKVQVAKDLVEELNRFDARLAKEAPEMVFDRSAVVEDALRIALRKANLALASRTRPVAP